MVQDPNRKYPEQDLNLHSFRNQILSLARLPIPPSGPVMGGATKKQNPPRRKTADPVFFLSHRVTASLESPALTTRYTSHSTHIPSHNP